MLEILEHDPTAYDLIISDYAMPVVSGIAVIRKARMLGPGRPALIVTGYAEVHTNRSRPTDGPVLIEPFDQKRREGKRILFEGAQGALLDVDHGTYPYVTSSNTVAAQAATGTGMGQSSLGYVLGICHACTTRVRHAPVPTDLANDTSRLRGHRRMG